MSVTPSSAVVGVFTDQSAAEQAMEALSNAGFEQGQMRYFVPGTPGFFNDLKSLFTGSGNLASELTNMGLSGAEVQYYSQMYEQGNTILAVNTSGDNDTALTILHQYGASTSDKQPDFATETMANTQQPTNDGQSDSDVQPATFGYDSAPYQTPANVDNSTVPFSQKIPNDPNMPFPHEVPDDPAAPFPRDAAETPYQASVSTPEQVEVEVDEVVIPTYQTGVDTSDQEAEEVETPTDQVEAPEQEVNEIDEVETLTDQTDLETPAQETDEVDEVETPVAQTNVDTPNQEVDEIEEVDEVVTPEQEADEIGEDVTPAYQTSTSTPEQQIDQADEVNYTETPTDEMSANAPAQTDVEQSPQPSSVSAEYSNQLQQLLNQVQATQQQLQEAKAELETAKQLETQYQSAKQELQKLQTELQATQEQLQETKGRLASYQ